MGSSSPGQQTSGPPDWLQGPIQDYLGAAGNLANQPYQQYQGTRVAPMTGLQEQALGGIGSTMYGSRGMDNAQNYVANLLGGPSGVNPGLEGAIQTGRRSVTDAYNNATSGITARYNEPGQWGGSAQRMEQGNADANLARGLGDVESQLRYQDYNNQANRQMSAIPLASQLAQNQMGLFQNGLQAGNFEQGYGQSLVDAQYNDWNNATNQGRNSLDWYGNALGRVMGGAGQTQTTQQPNNPWSNLLAAGIMGGSLFGKRA